jgi:Transcriptional regulator, AbiEi antitoxin
VKNKYTLTVEVADRNALADLLDAIGPYAQTAEIAIANGAPKALAAPVNAPKSRFVAKSGRGPKRSKVNDAIRARLGNGQATLTELKGALETAGMSPASLSTGIAALTKAGEIERVGDGVYGLKAA